jgi:hypothetical protein
VKTRELLVLVCWLEIERVVMPGRRARRKRREGEKLRPSLNF